MERLKQFNEACDLIWKTIYNFRLVFHEWDWWIVGEAVRNIIIICGCFIGVFGFIIWVIDIMD
jgi:hypothetical protein